MSFNAKSVLNVRGKGAGHHAERLVSSVCKLCYAGWPRVGDERWAPLLQGAVGRSARTEGTSSTPCPCRVVALPWEGHLGVTWAGHLVPSSWRCRAGEGAPRLCWEHFSSSSLSEMGWFCISCYCMNFNRSQELILYFCICCCKESRATFAQRSSPVVLPILSAGFRGADVVPGP